MIILRYIIEIFLVRNELRKVSKIPAPYFLLDFSLATSWSSFDVEGDDECSFEPMDHLDRARRWMAACLLRLVRAIVTTNLGSFDRSYSLVPGSNDFVCLLSLMDFYDLLYFSILYTSRLQQLHNFGIQ